MLIAIDLRGAYQEPHPYWNASTSALTGRLRADLEVLVLLAEDGLCGGAKDISMAGAMGTTLMLLGCSVVGAHSIWRPFAGAFTRAALHVPT